MKDIIRPPKRFEYDCPAAVARESDGTRGGRLDEPEAQHGLRRTSTEGWGDIQVSAADDGNESGIVDLPGRDQPQQMCADDGCARERPGGQLLIKRLDLGELAGRTARHVGLAVRGPAARAAARRTGRRTGGARGLRRPRAEGKHRHHDGDKGFAISGHAAQLQDFALFFKSRLG